MTRFLLFTFVLASLIGPVSAQGFTRIESESQFLELAVGKTLYLGDTTALALADGRLIVMFKGKEITGSWAWKDGYFCRVLQSYSTKEDCQLWEYDGEGFQVTRDKGAGKVFLYTLAP